MLATLPESGAVPPVQLAPAARSVPEAALVMGTAGAAHGASASSAAIKPAAGSVRLRAFIPGWLDGIVAGG